MASSSSSLNDGVTTNQNEKVAEKTDYRNFNEYIEQLRAWVKQENRQLSALNYSRIYDFYASYWASWQAKRSVQHFLDNQQQLSQKDSAANTSSFSSPPTSFASNRHTQSAEQHNAAQSNASSNQRAPPHSPPHSAAAPAAQQSLDLRNIPVQGRRYSLPSPGRRVLAELIDYVIMLAFKVLILLACYRSGLLSSSSGRMSASADHPHVMGGGGGGGAWWMNAAGPPGDFMGANELDFLSSLLSLLNGGRGGGLTGLRHRTAQHARQHTAAAAGGGGGGEGGGGAARESSPQQQSGFATEALPGGGGTHTSSNAHAQFSGGRDEALPGVDSERYGGGGDGGGGPHQDAHPAGLSQLEALSIELVYTELLNRVLVTLFETVCISGVFFSLSATPGKWLMKIRVVSCRNIFDIPPTQLTIARPPTTTGTTANNVAPPAWWPRFLIRAAGRAGAGGGASASSMVVVEVVPGSKPGLFSAFMRSMLKNFALVFFFPICITALLFQHHRTTYDLVAGTVVVHSRPVDWSRHVIRVYSDSHAHANTQHAQQQGGSQSERGQQQQQQQHQ